MARVLRIDPKGIPLVGEPVCAECGEGFDNGQTWALGCDDEGFLALLHQSCGDEDESPEAVQERLTVERVRAYLDEAIAFWTDREAPEARHYVDAFRMARKSLLGGEDA